MGILSYADNQRVICRVIRFLKLLNLAVWELFKLKFNQPKIRF